MAGERERERERVNSVCVCVSHTHTHIHRHRHRACLNMCAHVSNKNDAEQLRYFILFSRIHRLESIETCRRLVLCVSQCYLLIRLRTEQCYVAQILRTVRA